MGTDVSCFGEIRAPWREELACHYLPVFGRQQWDLCRHGGDELFALGQLAVGESIGPRWTWFDFAVRDGRSRGVAGPLFSPPYPRPSRPAAAMVRSRGPYLRALVLKVPASCWVLVGIAHDHRDSSRREPSARRRPAGASEVRMFWPTSTLPVKTVTLLSAEMLDPGGEFSVGSPWPPKPPWPDSCAVRWRSVKQTSRPPPKTLRKVRRSSAKWRSWLAELA